MTDEQKKKPGRDIGGINPYATFGGDDEETDNLESQQSTHQATKQSRKPTIQRTRKPDNRITGNSDIQISSNPESQKAQLSDSQIIGKQIVSYLRKKKPERKAQIFHLPPALIKRIKQYALDHEREMSEIATDAIEQYLGREE